MKALYLFVWICFAQQYYSHADDTSAPDLSKLSVACIGMSDLLKATAIACMQKGNTTLWQQIIDCHRPMTNEFMRQSAEARCAVKKYVQDPTNTCFSIQDVFFNICGLVEAESESEKNMGLNCLINGSSQHPIIMSHDEELRQVARRFGRTVQCDVGTCVKGLGLV